MAWTKRDIVNEAYTEIGYAHYDFDLKPEQLENALRRLDSIVTQWEAKYSFDLGYTIGTGGSDLSDTTTLTDDESQALALNLSIQIAPSVGKTPSRETRVSAHSALRHLINTQVKADMTEQIYNNAIGTSTGDKPWRNG